MIKSFSSPFGRTKVFSSKMHPYNRFQLQNASIEAIILEEKTFVLTEGLLNDLIITIDDKTTSQLYCGRPDHKAKSTTTGLVESMTASAVRRLYVQDDDIPKRYRYEVQQYNRIDENNIRFASKRDLT